MKSGCKYHKDCFSCPFADCIVDERDAEKGYKRKKAAPAAGTAKAAKPSKEGASKHIQHSTKPEKNQAATMVPETVGACADKSCEPLGMIAALQFLMFKALPQLMPDAGIKMCGADENFAKVIAEAGKKKYMLSFEECNE